MDKKESSVELRLEDLGKQLLEKAEPIEKEIVYSEIEKYIENNPNVNSFLLYSKEVGYFQAFIQKNSKSSKKALSKTIMSFLEETAFMDKETNLIPLSNVTFIQDEENVEGLSIWVETTYFQLMPFDFFIEYVD